MHVPENLEELIVINHYMSMFEPLTGIKLPGQEWLPSDKLITKDINNIVYAQEFF